MADKKKKLDAVIKVYPEEIMKLSPERYWDLVSVKCIKPLIVRLKIRQQAEDTENLKGAMDSGRP